MQYNINEFVVNCEFELPVDRHAISHDLCRDKKSVTLKRGSLEHIACDCGSCRGRLVEL